MSTEPVTVRVSRRFDAPPYRVFDAWLDPRAISRWMFGPTIRDEEIVRISLDPRLGGAVSFVVRRQGEEIDHVGEYLEIKRPQRLVFTWGTADTLPDTSRVTVEVAPQASGSELTLTHEMDPKWADYTSRIEASWTKMLASLDTSLVKPAN